jgi:pyruvate formate lyase activating enzyme
MMSAARGTIVSVRRFSTHDGPGIRTTVVLKGCPLRCAWCANPETQHAAPELAVLAARCAHLGLCREVCPEGAITDGPTVDRERCTLCMLCAPACPRRVYRILGNDVTADEVVADVEKDRPFYGNGGGVTLGGGEPLAQPELALALLAACRAAGIGTVLDTCGHAPPEIAEQAARLSDLILLDVKHMDGEAHRQETGVDNRLILANAQRMAKLAPIRVSVPLIPSFNDDEKNLRATADFARSIGALAIDLNPMHVYGSEMYGALGRPTPAAYREIPSAEHVQKAAAVLRSFAIDVTVGRMM